MDSYILQDEFDKARGNYLYMSHRLVTIIKVIEEKRQEQKGKRIGKSYTFTRTEFDDLAALVEDLYDRLERMFNKKKRLDLKKKIEKDGVA